MAAVQACAAVCVEGELRPGRWLWLRAVNQSFNHAAAWRELGGMEGGGGFAWHYRFHTSVLHSMNGCEVNLKVATAHKEILNKSIQTLHEI